MLKTSRKSCLLADVASALKLKTKGNNMSNNEKHAEFSPSQLPRIIKCPGSYKLSKDQPNGTSKYAEEGTMLHKVTETILRRGEYKVTQTEIKQYQLDREQVQAVQQCLDWAFSKVVQTEPGGPDPKVFIETKGSLKGFLPWVSAYAATEVGFPGAPAGQLGYLLSEVRGTLDFGVLNRGVLSCVDWKFGKGVRVAPETDQLKAYSLVLLIKAFGPNGQFSLDQKVEACIGQPRLNDDLAVAEYTIGELLSWLTETLLPALIDAVSDDPTFNPSEDACRWCRGKAVCKARHSRKQQDALDVFAHLADEGAGEEEALKSVDTEELVRISETIAGLVQYKKDIDAHLYELAMKGEKVPGKKLVNKRATRKWSKPEAEVAAALVERGVADLSDLYEQPKLLTVAKLEKVVGKLVARSEAFTELVVRESSGLTLVDESDRREAVEHNSPENAFSEFCS